MAQALTSLQISLLKSLTNGPQIHDARCNFDVLAGMPDLCELTNDRALWAITPAGRAALIQREGWDTSKKTASAANRC